MIERIVIAVMTQVTSWLLSRGLAKIHAHLKTVESEAELDDRLSKFKQAYKEAFNGEPITVEQRKALSISIRDFIRGSGM